MSCFVYDFDLEFYYITWLSNQIRLAAAVSTQMAGNRNKPEHEPKTKHECHYVSETPLAKWQLGKRVRQTEPTMAASELLNHLSRSGN
jgi:hypothetical protein